MNRTVQPELLDTLPPDDPQALGSRRDLRRVNAWMGNHALMAHALLKSFDDHPPAQITDLGAGDGHFLLRVAQEIEPRWPRVNAILVDHQRHVTPETVAAFAALGWRAEPFVGDVFSWRQTAKPGAVVIACLFLHHFEDQRLSELLRLISQQTSCFIALEPRRAPWPLFCSRLLWGIGCNRVTRHDAPVSVRAGFAGNELSARWPAQTGWQLEESRAGAFSHLFIARKTG